MSTAAPAKKTKKAKRTVPNAQVHIKASGNNTLISITDKNGGVLSWSSCGNCGFKGSKKSTGYAAQIASEQAAEKARDTYGVRTADVFIKGIGQGRDSAIRAIEQSGISVTSITEKTGVPHAGCRPRKVRRG